MSDNICDSWEDVDVDNIVIKPNDKKKSYAFVANNSLPLSSQSNNLNNSFDIVENGESIIVNNNDLSNDISSGGGAFRILPRANNISASNQVTTSVPASSILGLSGSERPSIILDDNSARSQFVNKLRILNRPSKADPNAGDKDRSSVDVNQLLMRSFEEKKAEYSKARLRILGEEMPAEKLVLDEVGDSMEQLSLNVDNHHHRSPTKSAKSVSSTNSSSSSSLLSNNNNNNNNRKATTQLSSITSSSLSTTANLISNTIATAATTNNLIRQPIVPDGTKGFGNRSNQNPNNNNNKSSANFSSPSTHRK